jgi:hypothetical protein
LTGFKRTSKTTCKTPPTVFPYSHALREFFGYHPKDLRNHMLADMRRSLLIVGGALAMLSLVCMWRLASAPGAGLVVVRAGRPTTNTEEMIVDGIKSNVSSVWVPVAITNNTRRVTRGAIGLQDRVGWHPFTLAPGSSTVGVVRYMVPFDNRKAVQVWYTHEMRPAEKRLRAFLRHAGLTRVQTNEIRRHVDVGSLLAD